MKKLNKKNGMIANSVEAYGIVCDCHCGCYCSCSKPELQANVGMTGSAQSGVSLRSYGTNNPIIHP